MKCSKHKNSDAVASCAACHAGVCKVCADATMKLRNECGTLCIPCYTNALDDEIDFYQEKRKSLLKNIIISCILYALGALLVVDYFTSGSIQHAKLLLGIFFCGFYSAISGWKNATKAHEEYEYKHGASYTVTDDGVYRNTGFFSKLIVALISMVLGVIITPFRVIANLIARKSAKNEIEYLEYEIMRVQKI